MENFNSKDPIHESGDRHLSDEEIRRDFAEANIDIDTPRPADTPESLKEEVNYIEKLTMVPLPVDVLKGIIDKVAREDDSGYDRDAVFKRQFIGAMQQALSELMQAAKPGDNYTFDDVVFDAEMATEHAKKVTVDSMLNDPSFVLETGVIRAITDKFAQVFDQHPDLEYIGDNIDQFTVHPDVHTYQQERVRNNLAKAFFGEEHGHAGRWIPEERSGKTVWVKKEQKQQEQKQLSEQFARDAVEHAYHSQSDHSSRENSPWLESEQRGDDTKAEMMPEIPDVNRDRIRFAKENFTGTFDRKKIPLLAAFLQKELVDIASHVPEGSMYPDTVAAVVGDGGDTWHYLRMALSEKQGHVIPPTKEFSSMPFSEVVAALGVDVRKVVPDYEQRFRVR